MIDYVAYADDAGCFYCRAVHAILSDTRDERVCGMGCPCYAGTDADGGIICRYESVSFFGKKNPQALYEAMQAQIADGSASLFPMTQRLGDLYDAYAFAAKAHFGQMRKQTTVPYLTHLITTLNYCLRLTDDRTLLTAAILHDTLEDTSVKYEDLVADFGRQVADYVQGETENKREELPPSETWEIRKRESIERMQRAPRDLQILVLADKTANAESMVRERRQVGDRLWNKFNQTDKRKQEWYYRSCAAALTELQDTEVMRQFQDYLEELFG